MAPIDFPLRLLCSVRVRLVGKTALTGDLWNGSAGVNSDACQVAREDRWQITSICSALARSIGKSYGSRPQEPKKVFAIAVEQERAGSGASFCIQLAA